VLQELVKFAKRQNNLIPYENVMCNVPSSRNENVEYLWTLAKDWKKSSNIVELLETCSDAGNLFMIQTLLETRKPTSMGNAFYYAVRQGHLDIIQLLLKHYHLNRQEMISACKEAIENKRHKTYNYLVDMLYARKIPFIAM
jgi:hypothetical protein